MILFVSPRLVAIFLGVLRARVALAAMFAMLAAAGVYGALRIPTDSAIDRLVVAGDPIAQATTEFERVFPEGEQALIVLEAPDPLSQPALEGAAGLERALDRIPQVQAHSLLTLYFHAGAPAATR